MWLRKLVGVVMIITCVGMNAVVIIGFFAPSKTNQTAESSATASAVPDVSLTAQPGAIAAGSFSALSWSATNDPSACMASGNWSGVKTPFGAESTGRLSTPGQYKYTLSCTNASGSNQASVTIAVSPASAPPPPALASTSTSHSAPTSTYCGGRVPCYGPHDVAQHSRPGDCWGYLGDRVINVGNFDTGFHAARSGVSNIQIAGVCGTNLAPAVNGQVGTPEYPNGHVHQLGATSNTDANYLGYFVGYFDSSKP